MCGVVLKPGGGNLLCLYFFVKIWVGYSGDINGIYLDSDQDLACWTSISVYLSARGNLERWGGARRSSSLQHTAILVLAWRCFICFIIIKFIIKFIQKNIPLNLSSCLTYITQMPWNILSSLFGRFIHGYNSEIGR